MFTRITGDQKRYVEDLGFDILDDCKMSDAEGSNEYCTVGDALVHLGTFYKEMSTGDPDATVQELVKPVKRDCVRNIKIEEAALRCMVKKYSRRNPDKTIDDLIAFLERYYQQDVKDYMDVIRNAWSIQLVDVTSQLV
jgi:spore cortex formation protein SpoVR/YcgB (stage V sporulation)